MFDTGACEKLVCVCVQKAGVPLPLVSDDFWGARNGLEPGLCKMPMF